MREDLDARKTALSLGAVTGILSAVCALLIAIAPGPAIRLFGAIFHGIDFSGITKQITLGGVVLGTVEAIVIALIAGWLFAWIYNKLS